MTSEDDRRTHRVYVIELDDAVGPRARESRPNLYVGTTSQPPEAEFQRIQSGESGHDDKVQANAQKLRYDLFEKFPATTRDDVDRQKKKLVCQLIRRGYRLYRYRLRRLYVIELDDSKGPRQVEGDWVYVGETALTPEARLQQHLGGKRPVKWWK